MVDFDGIGYKDRPKLTSILQAVQIGDLVRLYSSLDGVDEALRDSFVKFLTRNPIKGWQRATEFLAGAEDALSAVRSAAVCLLVMNLEGSE